MESGPAAGALAAAHHGQLMHRPDLLSFDMGGTTAKVCLIENGRPTMTSEFEVARLERFKKGSGLPIKISSVELIETGAGGGSIARVDRFGLVKVGPDSAGSEPGPACYGRGGSLPTVTDADLVLGYLDPGYFLGGRMQLDLAAAERALREGVAEPLDLDLARTAWTIHQLVNENMANAARVHAAERGRDAHNFPLFAFGGAGPVHAYRVAQKLGVKQVIAPFGAGVGSTIGLLVAPLAFDFVRTAAARVRALDWSLVRRLTGEMEREGRELLGRAGLTEEEITIERAADMRLIGQAHEITVPLPGTPPDKGDETRLETAFERTYSSLFARTPPNVPIEVVSWRVRVSGPPPSLALDDSASRSSEAEADPVKGERLAYFPEFEGFHPTPVYDRYCLTPGAEVRGPAVVEERESTVVIGPGGHARVDEMLNLLVEVS
jgi:N-methylhydantoinase A